MEIMFMIIGYVLIITMGLLMFLPKRKKETYEFKPTVSYKQLMKIVSITIDRELLRKFQIEYSVKEIKWVDNFEEELKNLSRNVMRAFSPHFLRELEYYHDRNYIYKMVVQQVQAFMIEYIKENKLKK